MARGGNGKLKLLYLQKLLLERTDEEHGMTMPEIVKALEEYGISAERKSLYGDIQTLQEYGMDIIGEQKGRAYSYYAASREFELPELKLLVDAVQSSKFVTERKSNELIRKLESLGSRYEAKKLQRQVYVSGRIKTMNESIYYNVDEIHNAISNNEKIRFQYFQWNVKKEMELRREGKFYCISPWGVSWDNENYYMIGYDSEAETIKYYRVDKMLKLSAAGEKREGQEAFEAMDLAALSRKTFSMFAGEEQYVKLEFVNAMAGVVIDRFGRDVSLLKKDGEHFVVNVNVAVSRQFLAWVISLGDGVRVLGPDTVIRALREEAGRLASVYGGEL
ncbi:MAG: WYL domain-containing protein [Dorea sp.]|nr:WYL domain-containing protein [Dorea sp.]